jgi:transposase-like protein
MICQEAGMPVSRFCRRTGIPRRTYRRWLAKARVGMPSKGPWPAPVVDPAGALVAKYAADWPAWGHRKVYGLMRADGHRLSRSSVERAMRRRGLLQSLGIVEGTLGNWVNKSPENGEVKGPELDVSARAELQRLRKEMQIVKMERDLLKESRGFLREPESVEFGFIAEQAAEKAFPIAFMCRAVEVSRQGFYQWRDRPPLTPGAG